MHKFEDTFLFDSTILNVNRPKQGGYFYIYTNLPVFAHSYLYFGLVFSKMNVFNNDSLKLHENCTKVARKFHCGRSKNLIEYIQQITRRAKE